MPKKNQTKKCVTINEDGINTHFSDFIHCPTVHFVIKPYEEVEVYIVEFQLERISKSYYVESGWG